LPENPRDPKQSHTPLPDKHSPWEDPLHTSPSIAGQVDSLHRKEAAATVQGSDTNAEKSATVLGETRRLLDMTVAAAAMATVA
jgi:hypothetical protein